jgi:hypothetical protein
MLLDQRFDIRHRVRHRVERQDRTAGHIAHHRPHQQRQIRLVENPGLEGAPHGAREHEIVVVVPIFRDRYRHQQIEDLDGRRGLPERQEQVVRQVPLAAPYRH